MLRVRLFGGLALDDGDAVVAAPRSAPARALLCALALAPGWRSRGELATQLWPDVLDRSARQSLRNALWTLRRELGSAGELVLSNRDRLSLGAVVVDVRELDAALADGDLQRAVALGDSGELLAGLDDDWARAAREAHRERVGAALAALADSAGRPGDAVGWARRRCALDPLSEDAARDLMLRLHAAGDRGAALDAFARLQQRLRRELRVAPSAATSTLAARLRAERPAPAADAHAAGTPPRSEMVVDPLPRPLPLIGRATELDALHEAWAQAHDGAGGAVVVEGPAGIGKSRLVAELAAEVASADGRVAIGAGVELSGAAPLTPWVELLRDLLSGEHRPRGEAAWPAELSRIAPGVTERVAPMARPPLRLGASDLDRVRLHDAIADAIAWAAGEAPRLLVLEDAHLADNPTLAVLAHLSRRLTRLPVLVCVTRRPGAGELDAVVRRLAAVGALRASLTLRALSSADARSLARVADAGLDDPAVRRVAARSDGSPLLIVETARAVAAGHEQPAPSLRAAVGAIRGALPEATRELSDLIAVAGRALSAGELSALAPDAAAAAAPALTVELLDARDGMIGFRHGLLRDAVLESLDPLRRRELHERVADGLLAARDARAGRSAEIARHLRLAGRDAEAVEHLAAAARQARDVAALKEAATYVAEAIALRDDDPDLWLVLAEVEALRGRREQAADAIATAIAKTPPGELRALSHAHAEYGRLLASVLCAPSAALTAYGTALELLDAAEASNDSTRTTADAATRAAVLAGLAWAEAAAGDPERVDPLIAEALALDAGDARSLVAVHLTAAQVHSRIRSGRFDEVFALADEVAAYAAAPGPAQLGTSLLIELAAAAACAGSFEQALGYADRYLAAVEALPWQRVEALAARSYVLARLDRAAEAVAAAEDAVAIADQLDHPALLALARHDLGTICCETGDHGRGVELLVTAIAERPRVSIPRARLRRAESLLALGRLDEADRELREVALEPVGPADQPQTLVPRLTRLQGLIAAARGDLAGACRLLEQAAAGWRRMIGQDDHGGVYMANIVDLGRPPVAGLTEPARELDRIDRERTALTATAGVA